MCHVRPRLVLRSLQASDVGSALFVSLIPCSVLWFPLTRKELLFPAGSSLRVPLALLGWVVPEWGSERVQPVPVFRNVWLWLGLSCCSQIFTKRVSVGGGIDPQCSCGSGHVASLAAAAVRKGTHPLWAPRLQPPRAWLLVFLDRPAGGFLTQHSSTAPQNRWSVAGGRGERLERQSAALKLRTAGRVTASSIS